MTLTKENDGIVTAPVRHCTKLLGGATTILCLAPLHQVWQGRAGQAVQAFAVILMRGTYPAP
ncbi:hypothetical protein N5D83_23990, partial [Pseudomonas chengduensis]